MTYTTTTTFRPGRAAAAAIIAGRPVVVDRNLSALTVAGETFALDGYGRWISTDGRECDATAAATIGRMFFTGRPPAGGR